MKRILVLCSLYFVASLSYADTCPQPPNGYIFRVGAWGNHVDMTSQIRCHYYKRGDESNHQEIRTNNYYHEEDMNRLSNWHSSGNRYYLCTSSNNNVNDCAFSRR
jgi:hypothetical protein